MSGEAVSEPATKRGFALTLAGFVLALVSPVFWAVTLDDNFLHRTALMMWIGLAVGLACAAWGAWRDARTRTRIVAVLTGIWALIPVYVYFMLTRLPTPTNFAGMDRVVEVVLSDHLGQRTSLSDHLREGPILLVFYRGHW